MLPPSINRGTENGAIKFISSLLLLYFLKKERGFSSRVPQQTGICSCGKKEARSEAVKEPRNGAEWEHVPLQWRVG